MLNEPTLRFASMLLVILSAAGCGQEPDTELEPAEAVGGAASAVQAAPLALGEMATLHMANDSTLEGLAVKIRAADGTEVYGVFRGPRKLGETSTQGTWVFSADSLPTRVRAVGPGERIVGGS